MSCCCYHGHTNSYPYLKEPFLYFAKEVFEMQETNFYEEHPENEGWWLNELDTLGIDTENNNNNELSDKQGNSNLVETIKQTLLD